MEETRKRPKGRGPGQREEMEANWALEQRRK